MKGLKLPAATYSWRKMKEKERKNKREMMKATKLSQVKNKRL